MPRTITSSMLHGGPLRIWSALTDPDHRRAWSPLVFLDDPSRLGDTSHGFRRARLSIAACEVRGGTADISGECDAERAG